MDENKHLEQKYTNYYDSLLESNSMVAHDISGLLHVLNFCAEELEEQMGGGNNYLTRMLQSLDSLNNIVLNFRRFTKDNKLNGQEFTFEKIFEQALSFFELHHWNVKGSLNISFSDSRQGELQEADAIDLIQTLFSLFCFINDEYRRKEFESGNVKLSLIKFDSKTVEFKILCEALNSSEEDFENFMKQCESGQKTFRKYAGLETLCSKDGQTFEIEQLPEGLSLYHRYQL